MPIWPTAGGFPQAPRLGSWRRQAADIISEFQPAVGPPRIRRQVTGAFFNCGGAFLLTEAQVETLEDFWRVDCVSGSSPFLWIDPEDLVTSRSWEWASQPEFSHLTADLYTAAVSLIRT